MVRTYQDTRATLITPTCNRRLADTTAVRNTRVRPVRRTPLRTLSIRGVLAGVHGPRRGHPARDSLRLLRCAVRNRLGSGPRATRTDRGGLARRANYRDASLP